MESLRLLPFLTVLFSVRSVTSQGKCPDSEFLCEGTWDCISKELLCDGQPDCEGGSDETSNLCQFRSCRRSYDFIGQNVDIFGAISPRYFRCDYGACIAQQFVCNGIRNCIDGSDETEAQCASHKCIRKNFRCHYGACIPKSYRCNGKADCQDASDETEELCNRLRKRCRKNYFRCKYGACIYHRKRCDGKQDCLDASDESIDECGSDHIFQSTSPTSPVVKVPPKTPKPKPTPPLISDINSTTALHTVPTAIHITSSTTTPFTPIQTEPKTMFTSLSQPVAEVSTLQSLSTLLNIYDAETSKGEQSPTEEEDIGALVNALVGSLLSGGDQSVTSTTQPKKEDQPEKDEIIDGSPTPPSTVSPCPAQECPCPEPLNMCVPCQPNEDIFQICDAIARGTGTCSVSTVQNVHVEILFCGEQFQFEAIDLQYLRSSGQVNASCDSEGVVPVNTVVYVECWKGFRGILRCREDGRWYSKDSSGQGLAVRNLCQTSGLNADNCGRFPPVRRGDRDSFQWPFLVGLFSKGDFICSGTIISSEWILTAAHCVLNFGEKPENETKEQLLTIRHPLFRDEDNQILKVSDVLIHPEFSRSLRLQNDVALLRLQTPLTFTEKLSPACVSECLNGVEPIYSSVAATFNQKSSGKLSWDLVTQTLDPSCFNRESSCSKHIDIGEDQFCARPLNLHQELSRGSSGGPYLVNEGSENDERWHVAGVLSYNVDATECRTRTVYSSVCSHRQWIRDCVEGGKCRGY